jgi:O-antigen ligase
MGLCDALAVSLIPFLFAAVRRERRWLVVAGAAVCVYGIWITGSRGALLTSLAILLLYPVITRSLGFGLVVAALGFLAPLGISQISDRVSDTSALGRLLGRGSSQYADQAREDAARVAIDQFTSHPLLGGGFGTVLSAHNIFLQLAAAAGILGLVFFLVVLWSLVRPLLAVPAPYGLLSVPALAYAMAGLLFPFLWDRYIWCVLGFALVGPILAQSAAEDDEAVAPEPVQHRARERL